MLPDDSIEPDTDKVFPLVTSSTLISFRSEGSDLAITWNPPLFISVNGSIDAPVGILTDIEPMSGVLNVDVSEAPPPSLPVLACISVEPSFINVSNS